LCDFLELLNTDDVQVVIIFAALVARLSANLVDGSPPSLLLLGLL
jgi:hypothetical protein